MQTSIRAGRRARHARYDIVETSGLPRETVDRIALALGIRSLAANARTADDDDNDDDDDSGDQHAVGPLLELGGDDLVLPLGRALQLAEGNGDGDEAFLRRALNRGYGDLRAGMNRPGSSWQTVLTALMSEVAGDRSNPRGRVPGRAIEVEIGYLPGQDREPVRWRVNDESGHANNANTRIAGASGKGKTQVLLRLLAEIGEQSPGTGAFIFDYKGDIAKDARFIASIGARVVEPARGQPIPLNPFELPGDLPPTIAARSFAELFASLAPGIGPVQRHLLGDSMRQCFDRARSESKAGPTLSEIRRAVLRRYSEAGRSEDTVTAMLDDITGLGLFAEQTMDIDELLSARWVIRLDSLGKLRQVVAFVVIEYLHNLASALADAAFDGDRKLRALRTIIAIDEAHYYLRGPCDALLGLIRIGRSKGMPVFLSSQSLEDYRGHTELDELFANTLVFGHGKPPSPKSMAGALALQRDAAKRASDRVTTLSQFEVLTNIAAGHSAEVVRCHAFFERAPTP